MFDERSDIVVMHGDSTLVLPTLEQGSADCMVTDPPYGTKVEADGYGRRHIGGRQIEGDEDLGVMDRVFSLASPILKPSCWVASFCSPKRRRDAEDVIMSHGFTLAGEVVWDKVSPGLGGGIRYQHEMIILARRGKAKGNSSLFSIVRCMLPKAGSRTRHPHSKPVSLVCEIVSYCSRPGDMVLDPFGGGGSTAVACMKTGRKCVLVESDDRWIPMIHRRVQEASTPLLYGLDD